MPERMRFFMGSRAYLCRVPTARSCPRRRERVSSRAMKAALLDLLYPRECAACGARIAEPERLAFCAACAERLEWIAPPSCPRCGAALAGGACGECAGRDFLFAGATALGKYEGRLGDFVLSLKFRGGRRWLADEFGRRLAARLPRQVDLLVPVPMLPVN